MDNTGHPFIHTIMLVMAVSVVLIKTYSSLLKGGD